MEFKSYLIAATPGRVCAFLPAQSINNAIQGPISDFSIRQVFHTLCYDVNEDDPWEYLNAIQQDCLTDEMKPGRMKTAQHVLDNVTFSQPPGLKSWGVGCTRPYHLQTSWCDNVVGLRRTCQPSVGYDAGHCCQHVDIKL